MRVSHLDLDLDIHSYERPLAASPFGTTEPVPDWEDTHAMALDARPKSRIDTWIRNDLGVRRFSCCSLNIQECCIQARPHGLRSPEEF